MKKKLKYKPCRCDAYPKFPHRPFGGKCEGGEKEECEAPRKVADPFGTGDKLYVEWECGCGKCD
jgi:hypothetical protein